MTLTLISARVESAITFVVSVIMCCGVEIRLPVNYTALAGDLEVHVQNLSARRDSVSYYVQLTSEQLVKGGSRRAFKLVSFRPLLRDNSTEHLYKAKFPCGLITRGGRYGVEVQVGAVDKDGRNKDANTSTYAPHEMLVAAVTATATTTTSTVSIVTDEADYAAAQDDIMELDVRWPSVSLSIDPQEIETYPDLEVIATIAFRKSYCEPNAGSLVPETWINLLYCGHSANECKLDNISEHSRILYSEQIKDYPSLRYLQLNCNLFGQAGYYTLLLTSEIRAGGAVISTVPSNGILKVKWSEKFVFNVHTRSIFQCDAHGGGVAVLFQYPNCILLDDKIRLFGSLQADVASSFPPASLHYITEQKVQKGKYGMHFDCDLFSEKYVEYCFVYVNQAITGAVSDVRMDCVPTFPISDNDAGQWSYWSEWSECSSTCKGGIRTRYRFCDSPSPKYGAKYCQGHSVETQHCGNGSTWECQLYDVQIDPEFLAEKPVIQEVVSEKCRCGCIIHLDKTMPHRFLAAPIRNCSQKILWKIEADQDYTIQLHMNRVHFPCVSQKLKIHDGKFLSSNLLAQFTSADIVSFKNFSIMSSNSVLLLEYSISENLNNVDCGGGFLCHFRQRAFPVPNVSQIQAESMSIDTPVEAVRLVILIMLAIILSTSICMLMQYINRYRKYQRASEKDDVTDTDCSETFSNRNFSAVISYETSTSTLISEIFPLQKLNKKFAQAENEKRTETNLCRPHSENDEENNSEKRKLSSQVNLAKAKRESDMKSCCNVLVDVHATDTVLKENIVSSRFMDVSIPEIMNRGSSRMAIYESRSSFSTRKTSISSSESPTLSTSTNIAPSSNSSLHESMLKCVKKMQNRKKMLIGSDLSLPGLDTELEMDYYDYNVHNTSTIPGSYLGMDPAYCVWIPPFAPGQWVVGNSEESDGRDDNNGHDSTSFENSKRRWQPIMILNEDDQNKPCIETLMRERFQKECKSKEEEKFKRYSSVSTTSSTRTVIADSSNAMTLEGNVTIREVLLSDSPVDVQKACVIKDSFSAIVTALHEKNDFKFVDEDEDSDTAYNSDENDNGEGVSGVKDK